jgi:hypothetical protein
MIQPSRGTRQTEPTEMIARSLLIFVTTSFAMGASACSGESGTSAGPEPPPHEAPDAGDAGPSVLRSAMFGDAANQWQPR